MIVNIKSLISMARDYVEKAKIDTDDSGSINSDIELNRLLAGTGASSIEDLTGSAIHEKVIERDTEKVFTTFMTTENNAQAEINKNILIDSIEKISDTYNKLQEGFNKTSTLMQQLEMNLHELEYIFDEKNFGKEAVDKVVNMLEQFSMITESTIKELDNINEEYKKTTKQDFPPIQIKGDLLKQAYNGFSETIKEIKTGSRTLEQAENGIRKNMMLIQKGIIDANKLKEQYKQQQKEDMFLLNKLLESQIQFRNDNRDKKEIMSRDLLSVLIDKTSPMTRNFVLQKAEETYQPENARTITGINQNTANTNIKRSSYKTQTEIYTLKGNNVIVSDYSGRILRSETLDPSVHKMFFE